jgi:hypothetical protein
LPRFGAALVVFFNCRLADLRHVHVQKIQEHDIPVLEHLTDITATLNEDAGTGFTLKFHFAPNDFFTNEVLPALVVSSCRHSLTPSLAVPHQDIHHRHGRR